MLFNGLDTGESHLATRSFKSHARSFADVRVCIDATHSPEQQEITIKSAAVPVCLPAVSPRIRRSSAYGVHEPPAEIFAADFAQRDSSQMARRGARRPEGSSINDRGGRGRERVREREGLSLRGHVTTTGGRFSFPAIWRRHRKRISRN